LRVRSSTAWAAAITSIASTVTTFSATRIAFRAAIVPMLTWSSTFAPVGIESALAGWQSTLFSDTIAAATYCGSMKPEWSAGTGAR
jgi:hypothetical protein